MLPRRGEVWLFDLGMAAKTRPVPVVSVDYGDADRAIVTVVPHEISKECAAPMSAELRLPAGKRRMGV
jgi:mRNA-degrading endonuclease toxin of MazEF toxin-antitoxin module